MNLKNFKIDLKIFKIDRNVYELRDKSFEETIKLIKDNHIKKLRHKFKDIELELIDPVIVFAEEEEFSFWSYCFRQPKEKYYWKVFLPDNLTESQDFDVVEFSYVLFIKYKSELYCVISGSGMNVIKKYLHPTFGVEIYQKISNPTQDNVIEMYTRSIANNISYLKQTFNLNQTISETLEYSDVPTKIKLKIRDDLKSTILKKYDLGKRLSILEVGSYFYLRKKIDFEELKNLIIDLHTINSNLPSKQLTLFTKINDIDMLNYLDDYLLELIIDDILRHENQSNVLKLQNDIIEVVHPSKLEIFYECDSFLIKYKFSKGKDDITVFDRGALYLDATKFIYNSLDNIHDRFKIKENIFKLNITGQINDKHVTYGDLFSHITAEIALHNGKKYFKIDGHWYILEDEFLNIMNEDAKEYYKKYLLGENILLKWNDGDDEDAYNKSYLELDDYYILDKVISENIEMCDLLIIKNKVAYFVHVKDGFNTKMRDLYIQVILSAKRLSNDLKNNKGASYLEKTLKLYNERNVSKKINYDDFIKKVKDKNISINFVMAFKNNHYKGRDILDRIDACNSNIAKYSLVQVIKEMQQFNFGINLIDISDL